VKIEEFPSVFTALFIDIFIKKRGGMAKNTLFYGGAVRAS